MLQTDPLAVLLFCRRSPGAPAEPGVAFRQEYRQAFLGKQERRDEYIIYEVYNNGTAKAK